MDTEWRIIPNYLNYSVSYTGTIKNNTTHKVLKHCVRNGYASVSLSNNGIKKTVNIHQIVASAFLKMPASTGIKYVVNHINENKLDNHVNNLEYTTYRENTLHSKTNKRSRNLSTFDLSKFIDIPTFSNRYMISKNGEIYSKQLKRLCCTVLLPSGYYKLKLKSDTNAYRDMYVHVLVAMAYLNYIPDLRTIVINHIDGCKGNNCLSNLEIITQKENMAHSITLNREKIFRKSVFYYDKDSTKIIYESAKTASIHTGIDHSSIIKSCKSDNKCAGKIKWHYNS